MTVVASNFDRQANDLYETPAWVTRALLKHSRVDGLCVWEPAAGNHKISDVLAAAGARGEVCTSDVMTYSRRHRYIIDFLDERPGAVPAINPDAIITNPPYGKGNRLAAKFCRLALDRCDGLVAMLLTAKFDFGKTRADLFGDNPRFAAKIALVDRIQWFDGPSVGTEDHAWYVWTEKENANRWPPRLLYAGNEGQK